MKIPFTEKFPTLERYAEYEFCRHGSKESASAATKDDLVSFALEYNLDFSKSKISKSELYHLIIDQIGLEALLERFKLGIITYRWQEKFDISSSDLRKLAKKGVVTIVGQVEINGLSGRYRANLYDARQFYQYSAVELKELL